MQIIIILYQPALFCKIIVMYRKEHADVHVRACENQYFRMHYNQHYIKRI